MGWYREEKRAKQRQAQQRYRQAHADELRKGRRLAHLLTRQADYHGWIEEAADLIESLVGNSWARALGDELARRKEKREESHDPQKPTQ
jgi:hypothetical protein